MGNQQSTQSSSFVDLPTKAPEGSKPRPSSFDPKHPSGDPTIDNADRGPCAASPTSGCYLSSEQRTTLVALYRHYVGDAARECAIALHEVKIEEKLKNTDEIPWYVNLVMSAVAAVLTDGFSLGISAGVGAATRIVSGAARSATDAAPALAAEVRKMFDVVALETPTAPKSPLPTIAAGKIVDAGNTAIKPAEAERLSADTEATKQKHETLSFVEYLRKSMAAAFKRLVTEPPSKLDDAELTALRDHFDPTLEQNQSPAFAAKFRSAIQEFQNSPVSQIGRRTAWDEKRGHERFELETRVAWLISKGSGRRLIYVDRAFSGWFQRQKEQAPSWAETARSSAYDSGHNQLSLQQDATWHGPLGDRTDHETPLGPDMMIKYVEPEFVELALQKQHDVWLAEPETFMLDYSYAPPKMIKVAGS